MEKQLRKVLKQIIKIVLAEINQANGTDYQMSDVWFDFDRSSLTNEQENIQNKKTEAEIKQLEINNVLNIAANVGDEQALKAICEIMEWDFDLLKGQLDKMNEEQNTENAKSLLGGVVTDEQAAEDSSGTIPE